MIEADYILINWKELNFENFATLQRGKDLTKEQFKKGNVPVAGSNGIMGFHEVANVYSPGVTVGRSGSVGKVTYYEDDFWAHNTCLYVKDFHGNYPRFTAYYLQFLNLARFKTGASVPTLDRNSFSKLRICVPREEEQRKIAAVLLLVQDAIAQQEQLITVTTELKKALMQKLLTEGTGNEPQKMTEIGLIPESWDDIPLIKIAKIGNGATPKKDHHEYWTNGNIPWLTSTKIHETIITTPDQYVTQKAVEECHLPLVRAGSLLVAITGQGKTLGNSALVEFDTRINQHLAYIQFNEPTVNEPTVVPVFILAFLQSRYEYFRQIARAGGSTKAALTCGFLKSYRVPLPRNKQEQLIIGQVFSSLNNKISIYKSKIILLQDLFRTLLHQLMTAQIRVDDLNLSALNLKLQKEMNKNANL